MLCDSRFSQAQPEEKGWVRHMKKEWISKYRVAIVLAVGLGGCAYDSASRIPVAESEQAVSAERQIERQSEIVLPTFPMDAKFRCSGIDLIISKVEVLLEEVLQPLMNPERLRVDKHRHLRKGVLS